MDPDEIALIRREHMELEQGWKSIPDMQEELRYYGLPDEGDRFTLMDRLYTAHEERWSPEGKMLDIERRFEVFRQKRLNEIEPFLWFNKLPKEIRLMVWEMSLPDQRIIWIDKFPKPLTTDYDSSRKDRTLHSPKFKSDPNPSALAVCRESRYIGLQRYRLAFGTPNIYADFRSDIFFLESCFLVPFYPPGPIKFENDTSLHPDLISDLQQVHRIGLSCNYSWTRDHNHFLELKDVFSKFKALEEVLLGLSHDERRSHEPPQVTLEYYVDEGGSSRPSGLQTWKIGPSNYDLRDNLHQKGVIYPWKYHYNERFPPNVTYAIIKKMPLLPEFKRKSKTETQVIAWAWAKMAWAKMAWAKITSRAIS